ncbi:hypothetical protein CRYUN_Cryun19dG0144600 [Craigia yunnanensis]
MAYRQRRYRQENYSYGTSKMSYPKLPSRVLNDTGSWQVLPAWEKRFCVKVGGMPWKRFVQAKKNLNKTDKKGLPSADMYIDKDIDWNPTIDPVISSEIKAPSDDDKEVAVIKEIDWFSIPLDQIKPTG